MVTIWPIFNVTIEYVVECDVLVITNIFKFWIEAKLWKFINVLKFTIKLRIVVIRKIMVEPQIFWQDWKMKIQVNGFHGKCEISWIDHRNCKEGNVLTFCSKEYN